MQQKLVDTSKINALGWSTKHSLKDGINETYKFFMDTKK
jgi:nucleoside-diphosphate-sugar epimerase